MKKFIVTPFGEPKELINESKIRDMVGAPSIEEELEEQARVDRNECVCGVINCSDEYAHMTSGY